MYCSVGRRIHYPKCNAHPRPLCREHYLHRNLLQRVCERGMFGFFQMELILWITSSIKKGSQLSEEGFTRRLYCLLWVSFDADNWSYAWDFCGNSRLASIFESSLTLCCVRLMHSTIWLLADFLKSACCHCGRVFQSVVGNWFMGSKGSSQGASSYLCKQVYQRRIVAALAIIC